MRRPIEDGDDGARRQNAVVRACAHSLPGPAGAVAGVIDRHQDSAGPIARSGVVELGIVRDVVLLGHRRPDAPARGVDRELVERIPARCSIRTDRNPLSTVVPDGHADVGIGEEGSCSPPIVVPHRRDVEAIRPRRRERAIRLRRRGVALDPALSAVERDVDAAQVREHRDVRIARVHGESASGTAEPPSTSITGEVLHPAAGDRAHVVCRSPPHLLRIERTSEHRPLLAGTRGRRRVHRIQGVAGHPEQIGLEAFIGVLELPPLRRHAAGVVPIDALTTDGCVEHVVDRVARADEVRDRARPSGSRSD